MLLEVNFVSGPEVDNSMFHQPMVLSYMHSAVRDQLLQLSDEVCAPEARAGIAVPPTQTDSD
jgi:hypothetical protein